MISRIAGAALQPEGTAPMRYEKAETVLRIAADMQGTAEGLSLEDIRNNYADRPLSRRTAERLRDAIERVFPQMEQANPGALPKRWRIRAGTLNGLVAFSASEVAALQSATALSLIRENGQWRFGKLLGRKNTPVGQECRAAVRGWLAGLTCHDTVWIWNLDSDQLKANIPQNVPRHGAKKICQKPGNCVRA